VFFFALSPSYAAVVTPGWDANTEPDLDGYKVYYKNDPSGAYDVCTDAQKGKSPITVSIVDGDPDFDPDNPEYILRGLDGNKVYFFVVTAYDTEELESNYSNEVAILPIISPQDGFYVNASNFMSYMAQGKASPDADDIIVKSGPDRIGGTFTADEEGNWSGACYFSSISEGSVSLTAESDELDGITVDPVTGTYDKTAPGKATSLSSSSMAGRLPMALIQTIILM